MDLTKWIRDYRILFLIPAILSLCTGDTYAQVTVTETVITDANGFEGPDACATIFGPETSGRFDFSKLDNGFNPTACEPTWTCFPLKITIDPSFSVPTGCVADYCGNVFVDSQGAQRKIYGPGCNLIWEPANGNASTDYTFCIVPGSTVNFSICKSAADPNPNVAVSFFSCCTPSEVTCPADAALSCTDSGSTDPDFSGIQDGSVFAGLGGTITMDAVDPCAACDPSTACIDIDYMDTGVLDFCAASNVTRTYTIELAPAVNFVRLGTTTDANGFPVPDIGPAPPQTCTTILSTIVDDVAPTITCPANATFFMDATCAYDLSSNALPTVSDNCGPYTLSSTDDLSGMTGCSGTGTIIKTHVATDDCGNTASCMQTITIEDNSSPMITCGMDLTIAMDAGCMYDLSSITPAAATDNCAAVTVSFTDDLSGLTACSGTGAIVRTWTATDDCTNASTCMQNIVIEDQMAPTLSCPATITLGLDAACAVDLSSIADPTIMDNCPGVTVASSDDMTGLTACSGTGTIIRTWTVSDACATTATCTQNILIEDQTDPAFICPMDVTLGLDAACAVDLSSIADPVVTDNCPAASMASSDDMGGLTACSGTGTIIRTWTATDACSNTSACTQNIIIEDQTIPTFTCPSEVTIALDAACNLDLSSVVDPTVMDNCPGAIIASSDDTSGLTSCSGTGTIIRTWTATDACLNSFSCTQNIIIEDQDAPTFTCPAEVTLAMDGACTYDLNSIADPALMDNCAGATIASADDLSGLTGCSGTGTIVRTWTANDACMNSSACTQNIIIEDQTAPTFSCPLDVTLAIDASCIVDLTSIVDPTVSDNCPSPTIASSDDTSGLTGCSGTGTIIRTWTATDACSNATACVQNIIIEDQTAPTFTCPAEITLALDAACVADLSSIADPAIIDNCPGALMSSSDDLVGLVACSGTGTIVRTWTATDACMNITACTQNIVIEDQTDPIFLCPGNVTLALDGTCSNDLSSIVDPVITDNCPGSVLSIVDDVTGLTGCNATGTILRTWTANDACGNTSSCVQTIVLEDQTVPIITCPAEATVSMDAACAYDADPALTDEAVGTDNCAIPSFSYTDDISGLTACSGTGTFVRTWTATDMCGLVASCAQNIIVEDIDPPSITCPIDLNLTAGDPTNDAQIAAWLLTVSATDNCSVLSLTNDYDVANFMNICGASESQTVTFTAVDDCGNSIMCMATIIIGDMTPPIITCPTNLVLECADPANSTLIADWLTTVTASDPGGGGTIVMDDYFDPGMFTDDCGLTGAEEVVFTATDDCMLMSMCTATITIEDTTPATLTCPTGTMIAVDGSCSYDAQPVTIGLATATDACAVNALVPTYVDDMSGLTGCSGTGQISRSWSVEDECGNMSSCTQILIVIEDIIAPIINCPPVITITIDGVCAYDADPAITGVATGSDNCEPPTITHTDDLAGLGACNGTGLIERTWTATDACLNVTTCLQIITVEDQTIPSFVCPAAAILDMDATCNYDLTTIVAPSTSDNCPGEVLSFSDDLSGLTECSGTGLIVRTWTLSDACSNSFSCTQDITIQDIEMPLITCPTATTVALGASCTYDITMTGDATVTDNCPLPTISSVDDLSGLTACNGTGVIVRTFTATDGCGNTSSCTQSITIADQTVPTIVCPVAVVISLDGTCGINLGSIIAPVAMDNCPGSVVTFADDNSALTGCSGTGVITRTWSVVDVCSNMFSCTQVITIVDQIIPTFTCPADVTIAMDGTCAYSLATILDPVVTDNCPGSTIASSDDLTGLTGCNNTGIIVRTWTARDACNNSFSCMQNIEIVDDAFPTFLCPAEITMQLDASCSYDLATLAYPVISDNCPGSVMASADDLTGLTACSGSGLIIRTWTATDGCDNQFSCTQNIVIEDTTLPTVTCPMDITIALDDNCTYDSMTTAAGDAAVTDNCPGASISYSDDLMGIMGCSGTGLIIRTFTAVDACNNMSSCTQNITVEDQTIPTVTCPGDITLPLDNSCGYDLALAGSANTYDNCPNAMLNFSDDLSGLTGCNFTGQIIRTYVVEDACGNSSSCQQIITGEDQTLPTFTCPGGITIALDAMCLYSLASITEPATMDNCPGTIMSLADDLSGLIECNGTGTIVRTWTATDACNNISSCTQNILIEDQTGPTFMCPGDITMQLDVACNYNLTTITSPTVMDNCSGTIINSSDDLTGLTGCGGTGLIVRTWTATDGCGSTAECTQNVTLEDIELPVITCPAPITVALDAMCGYDIATATTGDATVTDNCSGSTITSSDDISGLTGCSGTGIVTRTFTASDACSNMSSCTQLITIQDQTVPTIVCPGPVTLAVDATCMIDLSSIVAPTAMDNCPNAVVSFSDDNSGLTGCAGTGLITRTWTVTDACTNAFSCTQLITIEDQIAPTFACPAEVTIAMDASCNYSLASISIPITMDNCPGATIVLSDDLTGLTACSGTGTIVRTWTLTDPCNNTASCTQNIIIEDQMQPTFDCPAELTIQLDAICAYDLATVAIPVVMDNCTGATMASSDDLTGLTACSGTGLIIRTWTATDACSNTAQCTQNIVVEDIELPVITCPAPITVALDAMCGYDIATAITGDATVTDNCPGSTITSSDDISGLTGCSGTGIVPRTFTASDACSNMSSCTQLITIEDQTVPTIVCPGPVTLAVDATCMIDLSSIVAPTAVDNCPNAVVSFGDDNSGLTGCAGTGLITRTWTVTDACANAFSCTQLITIEDQTAPTFTCPAEVTIAMDASCNYSLASISIPIPMDNCPGATIVSSDDLTGLTACSGTGTIVRSWTLTDPCNNTASCTQNIIVEDQTQPTFDCPVELTIQLDGSCAYDLATVAIPTVLDNCPDATMGSSDDLTGLTGCSGTGLIIRTWTATDACNNFSTCEQNIILVDDSLPALACPMNVVIALDDNCVYDSATSATGDAVYSDNCIGSTLSFSDDLTGLTACSGTGVIVRTFDVIDACNNLSSCTQNITVEDQTIPTVTCPADIVLALDASCGIDLSLAGSASTYDNCPNSVLTFADDLSGLTGCSFTGLIIRTYVVEDACGNSSSCQQNITGVDQTDPTFTCPAAVTLYMDTGCQYDLSLISNPVVTDNCIGSTISSTDDLAGLTQCSGTGEIIRTWTATDACGNFSTCDQSITIQDLVVPVISCPANTTIYMDAACMYDLSVLAAATATDNCTGVALANADDLSGLSGCGGTGAILRTWTATDDCLNASSCIQTINVEDNLAPILVAAPPAVVSCEQDVQSLFDAWIASNGNMTTTDNCSTVTWTTIPAVPVVNSYATGPICVTFVATDVCGNSDSSEGKFYVTCAGVAKSVTDMMPSQSGVMGNFDVTYSFIIKNTGNTVLDNISLVDDMAAQMGGAFVGVVSAPSLVYSTAATSGTTNNSYLPSGDNELLGPGWILNSCDSIIVEVIVEIDPDNPTAIYSATGLIENQATVSGTDDQGNTVADDSDSGDDPTGTNGDGGEDDPTLLSLAAMGLGKQIVGVPVPAASGVIGNYEVTYQFIVKNTGVDPLYNLSVTDNLAAQMGGAYVAVVTPPTLIYTNASVVGGLNGAYGPSTDNEMLGSGWELIRCDSIIFDVVVEIDPDNATAIYDANGNLDNSALVSGENSDGVTVNDISENGDDPIGDANGDGSSDTPTPLRISDIGVAKGISSSREAISGTMGNFDVTYSFVIKNTGNTVLSNISLIDNFVAEMGGAYVGMVTPPALMYSSAMTSGSVNTAFNPSGDNELLGNGWVLSTCDSIILDVTVEIDPDNATAIYGASGLIENQAAVTSTDDQGSIITDLSDEGNDPSGTNGEGGEDGPTRLSLSDIGIGKQIVGTPAVAASGVTGNYDVTYEFIVKNTGLDDLYSISVIDDMSTQMGGAFVGIVTPPTLIYTNAFVSGNLNTGYSPSGANEMLGSGWELRLCDSIVYNVVVEIDPDNATAIYDANGDLLNSAVASGVNGAGISVSDDSENGDDPVGDSDGDGSSDTATPLRISDIGLAKNIADVRPAVSGTVGNFDVTYGFVVKNTGNTELGSLSLEDDLATQLGGAYLGIVTPPYVLSSTASTVGGVNTSYNPSNDSELLGDGWILNTCENIIIELTVEVDPDSPTANFVNGNELQNQASITAIDEGGAPISDDSDSGDNPSSDNPSSNDHNGTGDDPTRLFLPHLTVNKVSTDIQPSGNGNYINASYLINVENTGNDILTNVNVTDALMAQLGGAFVSVTALPSIVSTTATTAGTSNLGFNPDTNIDLLAGNWTLDVGEMIVIELVVEVDFLSPTANFNADGDLENQAVGVATDSEGNTLNELSDSEAEDDPTAISPPFAKAGGRLWNDCDGDGIQDFAEGALEGMRVELYAADGTLVAITSSDSDGRYLFDNVFPGTYYMQVIAPDYEFSIPNQGGSNLEDSDVDGSNGVGTTAMTTLTVLECNLEDFDAGIFACVKLGEHVWRDLNMNDQRDANDNGINGLKVELYRWNGVDYDLYDSQYTGHKPGTTSDDGYYKFCAPPGKYYLKFVNPPATLVSVIPQFGIDANMDSDLTGQFGPNTTGEIELVCGVDKYDIGAGFYTMGTIGDYVWHDTNFDGLMDPTEDGVSGVRVNAINPDGNMIAQAMTDANGNYLLDYLGKGLYYLEFIFPNGFIPTHANMGTDEDIDSDLDDSHGPNTTDYYIVMPDSHTPNADVGVVLDLLPITWTEFWGENRMTHNFLEWGTVSERNSSHFEIERSIDGTHRFSKIGTVLSAGNTTIEQVYNFEDYDILNSGIYYYRVKQIDLDGQFTYSDAIAINITAENRQVSMDIYPNPVIDDLQLKVHSYSDISQLSIKVYDNLGQSVMECEIVDLDISAGTKDYDLKVTGLTTGTYYVKAVIDGHLIVKKIIKVD